MRCRLDSTSSLGTSASRRTRESGSSVIVVVTGIGSEVSGIARARVEATVRRVGGTGASCQRAEACLQSRHSTFDGVVGRLAASYSTLVAALTGWRVCRREMSTSANERTAFVTGGSGFIGGRLIERLVPTGWEVRALARSRSSSDEVAPPVRSRSR